MAVANDKADAGEVPPAVVGEVPPAVAVKGDATSHALNPKRSRTNPGPAYSSTMSRAASPP